MSYTGIVSVVSDWAAILTATVAVVAYGKYLCHQRSQTKALEEYLKAEKNIPDNKGQRTITHLMARLSMTEAEVVRASFRSKKVKSFIGTDDKGRADVLLFQHDKNSR